MNEKYISPFIHSIKEVLSGFICGDILSSNIYSKDTFVCKYNFTTIVGLSGCLKGNVALSMHSDTAKKIASAMMMGMEITEIDEMSVSALGELTNMICGQALVEFSSPLTDLTPPTIIHGDNMKAIISQIETAVVEIISPVGNIELNLGIEM